MLTAQALVAPTSSNTAPRSHVIRDRAIAVMTRKHCVSPSTGVHSLQTIPKDFDSGLTERCSEYEMEIRIIRLVRKPEILDSQLRPQCPEKDWTDKNNLSAHEAFCDVVSLVTN